MGIDFIWLLPIHPIGLKNRKGNLGSPYSISDFRQINPEYGNIDDFRRLVSEIHRYNIRLMIDIVFRHTSHDCHWIKEHPEWYLTDNKTVKFIYFNVIFKKKKIFYIYLKREKQ